MKGIDPNIEDTRYISMYLPSLPALSGLLKDNPDGTVAHTLDYMDRADVQAEMRNGAVAYQKELQPLTPEQIESLEHLAQIFDIDPSSNDVKLACHTSLS